MFDKEIAKMAIQGFADKGIRVTEGLTVEEIQAIESLLNSKMPEDLKTLLSVGVPTGIYNNGHFPDWHSDKVSVFAKSKEYIDGVFAFDIEQSDYWHSSFGLKPSDVKLAKKQALEVIDKLPTLIPIYGHRYMSSYPAREGNPIISIQQPIDTVYYGYDLVDYLFKEFGIELPIKSASEPKDIPHWGELFFDTRK